MRALTGLNPVSLNSSYCEKAQYGAVLSAANGNISHRPSKPSDMPDDFYQLGYRACCDSNLSTGVYNLTQSIFLYMRDTGANNVPIVGHRRWILAPTRYEIGFGYAYGKSATYVFEEYSYGRPQPDFQFISWPASGDFPSDFCSSLDPWSISLNEEKLRVNQDALTVTITTPDGRSQTFNNGTGGNPENISEAYFNYSNMGYGTGPTIIFRPGGAVFDFDFSGICHVEVNGLTDTGGNAVTLSYDINFFDL